MGGDGLRQPLPILSEFPVALLDDRGAALDMHAIAHQLSEEGFQAEAVSELREGQVVRYRLSLDTDGGISGFARVVWCERTDISYRAALRFLKLTMREKRRVRRVMNPSALDWSVIADKAIVALSLLIVTVLLWSALRRPLWRGIIAHLIPRALAALAMGWALLALLRRG